MTKALLKKQLLEMLAHYAFKGKNGRRRSRASLALYAVLMLYIAGLFAYLGYSMASLLCAPLADAGLDWLYFAVIGIMATVLGVVGSVFAAQSQIYDAKDNDSLLAMPIPPMKILFVRMLSLYIQALVMEAVLIVPAEAVYIMNTGVSAVQVILVFLTVLIFPLAALILSLILGWVVALISGKFRNKSAVTAVLSLAFFAGYYYLYFNAYKFIGLLAERGEEIGAAVRRVFYPIYLMGMGASGELVSFAVFVMITAAVFGAVCLVLARSFLRIASGTHSGKKKAYRGGGFKKRKVSSALFLRELRHFAASPVYLLNSGIGTVFLAAGAVICLVKREYIADFTEMFPGSGNHMTALITAVVCAVASANSVSAPSVSLEGTTLWQLQSMPVPMTRVITAKLKLHMMVTLPAALLFSAAACFTVGVSAASCVLSLFAVSAFVLMTAAGGLAVNIMVPNLNWSSEAVAVKQGMSSIVSIFGSWGVAVLSGVMYYFLTDMISPSLSLAVCAAAVAILDLLLCRWLVRQGADRLAAL